MRHRARLASLGLAALAMSGCGTSREVADGRSCFPADARPFIGGDARKAAAPRDPGGAFELYLDGSASMVGFLRGATAAERPMADLIGMLPQLDGIDHGQAKLIRFDRRITELPYGAGTTMQTEAGYLCPASTPNCDRQESHLDQALGRVAAAGPATLSLVLSDLWLANSEVRTSEGVALARPLNDILRSGRSIAVYGFESPYSGRVTDLPSGRRDVTARRRYLFVIAVGPVARLQALHSAMLRASSATIQRALNEGDGRYALFTAAPMMPGGVAPATWDVPVGGPFRKAAFLPVRAGARVPQFTLDRGAALRGGPKSEVGATWPGLGADQLLPGAVWTGASDGATTLYRMAGASCLPDGGDWRRDGTLASGWRNGRFTMSADELARLPAGRYLLVGSLRRTGVASPNPAAAWMREWSFDPAGEPGAIARPVVPTLNLAEFARLLENALAGSVEAKPAPIGGFAAAVDIK